jgi:hypothetical protein
MSTSAPTIRVRRILITVLITSFVSLGEPVAIAPAWAHGSGETEVGYQLVLQALGHLAHQSDTQGVMPAMEKIDDALRTTEQQGVDVAELKQAKMELMAGNVAQGRALLQHSITQALSQLPPPTGEDTGTKIVLDALPGRGALTATDWGFLIVSILLLLFGVGMSWRFRPTENIRELRQKLNPPGVRGPSLPKSN